MFGSAARAVASVATEGASRAFLDEFSESMPATYRRVFDDVAIEAHAAIVQRRGSTASRVEVWRQLPGGVLAVCVVAEDIIGLLSRICAAVFAHGADIVAAQAYGRIRDDFVMEAVAVLWIRRATSATGSLGPLRAQDVARIGVTLDALVRRSPNVQRTVRLVRTAAAGHSSTAVDFETDASGGTVLTVRADDRPGLILAITRTLFRERVQILLFDVETERGRAVGRFWVEELDGAALDGERQVAVRTSVIEAVDERRAKLG
jgi:UTP:GlnB (protein PII) uridylyltransferase